MNKLASLRRSAGLTQQALADKSGVNIRQIQKIEGGETSVARVPLRNAVAIADALNVDVKKLLD